MGDHLLQGGALLLQSKLPGGNNFSGVNGPGGPPTLGAHLHRDSFQPSLSSLMGQTLSETILYKGLEGEG